MNILPRIIGITAIAFCAFAISGCDQPSSQNPSASSAKTTPPQAPPAAPPAPTPTPAVEKPKTPAPAPAPVAAATPPQPATAAPPASATTPPLLTFDSDTYDFGTFPETQKKSASLKFTNTGGQTLIINKINTSCGCTTAKMDKMQYAPGESGQINLTLEPSGPGTDNKLVNIYSNAKLPPTDDCTKVTLRANIQAFLTISPRMIPDESGKLVEFEFRKPHEFAVNVTCPPDENFTIEKVTTTDPHCTAKVVPSAPGVKGKTINVTVDADAPWGGFFSWLEITGKGKPAPDREPITHTSKIRVQIKLFGKIQADPDDTFRFGAKPGEKFERKIRLRRLDGQPLTVTSATVVSCDIAGAMIASVQTMSNEVELTLTMTADQLRPRADGLITVTTNVPGEEQINIPILGVVRTDAAGVH